MKIITLTGKIEVITGLHIGGGDDVMKIGGIDNPVIKVKRNDKKEPYIPGSSLKGKMRSLLEHHYKLVELSDGNPFNAGLIENVKDESNKNNAINLLKIFGNAKSNTSHKDIKITITRISVGDAYVCECESLELTEAKYENTINRIKGTAEHPRQTERVPAGIKFKFDIRLKIFDEDEKDEQQLKDIIKQGLKLIEQDYLGGCGSRGYGRVKFTNKDKWEEYKESKEKNETL
ncbi:type III-A CRISPR-associated RAMP protein Csm3 [Helicobacter cetorum]|uniref:type III-A CRISPR-associated RAMP protein Csm3 n=1 Tax=Helicobacter cetorum TaxID=138563 RepID=UPI000CF0F5FC|nr:type III-A CRISPR-associated RAMP protein Csm3 [Helicobacter cetorum]